jgi:hypothetical protein
MLQQTTIPKTKKEILLIAQVRSTAIFVAARAAQSFIGAAHRNLCFNKIVVFIFCEDTVKYFGALHLCNLRNYLSYKGFGALHLCNSINKQMLQ